jgi:iron(III) transport system substrate-binding protein
VRRLLALAAALALSACGVGPVKFVGDPRRAEPMGLDSATAGRPELADLYRRALLAGETTVVVYSCTGDSEWEPLWREFEATFPGLTVTYSHISPSQVMTRIDSESVTGRHFGDVYLTPVNLAEDVADKGYFERYTPSTLQGLDARYRDPDGLVHYAFGKVFGLAYNPERTSPDRLPQKIDDVLAPRWRGRFNFIKPATQNGTPDVAIANLKHDGAITRAQLEGLRDNGAYGAIEAGVTYVSQGRQDLQLWSYLPTVVRQNELGAPVRIAFTPDFSTIVPFGTSISRNVVHPNAARLFEAWLFTPRAQAVLARDVAMYATMPGAPRPPFFPDAAGEARLHPTLPPKALQLALNQERKGLKAIFSKSQ